MTTSYSDGHMLEPFTGFRYEGTGEARFENGFSMNVKFRLQLHKNGVISGELEIFTYDIAIWSYFKKGSEFTLSGQENRESRSLIAKGCHLVGLNDSKKKSSFSALEVLVSHDVLKDKPKAKLHLHFGVVNVWDVFRGISVETSLGPLKLVNYEDIKESEKLMSLYHLPLITSGIVLVIDSNGSDSLRDLIEKATKIVWDFLKITSLAQTLWHDWALLEVSEVLDEENMGIKPIFHKLRSPKSYSSYIRMNATAIYLQQFVCSAWRGYSSELAEKYGFDMALEWYIQSNSGLLMETKFLAATTCLEMLTDKFHSQNKTDKLLDDKSFNKFYKQMKGLAKEHLTHMGVNTMTQVAICNSMLGIQRRSFVDKEFWDISYSDTGVTLKEIKDVRNSITHQGKYVEKSSSESVEYLWKVYNGLFNILTRILLAMLKFDAEYFDAPNSKWIRFRDVCSKN